jgi:hypothetical protein
MNWLVAELTSNGGWWATSLVSFMFLRRESLRGTILQQSYSLGGPNRPVSSGERRICFLPIHASAVYYLSVCAASSSKERCEGSPNNWRLILKWVMIWVATLGGLVFIPHLLRHFVPLLRRIQLLYSQPRFSNVARYKRFVWLYESNHSMFTP